MVGKGLGLKYEYPASCLAEECRGWLCGSGLFARCATLLWYLYERNGQGNGVLQLALTGRCFREPNGEGGAGGC